MIGCNSFCNLSQNIPSIIDVLLYTDSMKIMFYDHESH